MSTPTTTRPGLLRATLAFARNTWRRLTSMRTALVLLFLLALASLPGAMLPQWTLNRVNTAQWILDHPKVGPILDDLGFFGVFGSPWYAAVYLLLFTSLIGCITPRTVEFVRQLRAEPVLTPRNLARLPHHAVTTSAGTPAETADAVQAGLRGWRTTRRSEGDGLTISAEKGYLREVGNLLFHLSLLGILLTIAVGKLVGYEGTVAVKLGEERCLGTPVAYDNFRPGMLVDGTELTPLCTQVTFFDADYTANGIATAFRIELDYQTGDDAVAGGEWTSGRVQVNEPLRFDGERLYLLGHGFAPTFEVTYPNGEVRSYQQIFHPADNQMLSEGAILIPEPPGGGATQMAIQGIFAPTAVEAHGNVLTSVFPRADNPAVAIEVYQGDLGRPATVYELDQDQIDSGELVAKGRANLYPGESMTIEDGTVVTFVGFDKWVSLQVSYDPAQGWTLISAITMILGLMMSLTIKRRRVWYRIIPAEDGSRVEVGGLARTDQAGYGSEFSSLIAHVPSGTVRS